MTPQEVAGDKSTFISFDEARYLLDAESGTRPRIYGLLRDQQIVSLKSSYYLDKYAEEGTLMEPVWISGTTVTDLIRRA